MAEKIYGLPEFPCERDVWDCLKNERRPIVVYGMGNGADKLFRRFETYGIKACEIFASDGFVRGHSYRGYKVKSFSEIKERYSDFVIVLSFASNRREVIDMLSAIDKSYELYIPDMPVADESEYFDKEFYNQNYERIVKVYNSLADSKSRNIYAATLHYKLSGKLEYLLNSFVSRDKMYSLLPTDNIRVALDLGAYNGDTAREAIEYFPSLAKIYAVEPDRKNYKRLLKFAEKSEKEIFTVNAAAWSESASGSFQGSGNRNSSVSSTASYEHKSDEVELITVDSLNLSELDYIKYDVEGAEYEALLGSCETVRRLSPSLLVSLYHRSRDIFALPEYLEKEYESYKFYVRRLESVPAWELNLIMIPNLK